VFTERSDSPPTGSTQAPPKYWDIKLAWSERRSDGWSAKQVAAESMSYHQPVATALPDKRRFALRTIVGETLTVGVYLDSAPAQAAAVMRAVSPSPIAAAAPAATVRRAAAIARATPIPTPRPGGGGSPTPTYVPTIGVTPQTADRRVPFTIDGVNFRGNETVTVTVQPPAGPAESWDITTRSDGRLSKPYNTTVKSPIGQYAVSCTGATATVLFTVTAPVSLDVSPSAGLLGTTFNIAADGLPPNVAATFTITTTPADGASPAPPARTTTATTDIGGVATITHVGPSFAATITVTVSAGTAGAQAQMSTSPPPPLETHNAPAIGKLVLRNLRSPVRASTDVTGIGMLIAPVGTVVTNVAFEETGSDGKFSLFELKADGKTVGGVIPILERTPGRFRIVAPWQELRLDVVPPLFFQDDARVFAVTGASRRYRFASFYHANVDRFVRQLDAGGLDALLQRHVQSAPKGEFAAIYGPFDTVTTPYPSEDVQFDAGDAYAQYNWELFFHAPLLIANRLMNNQRFAEAQRWFHYVFDPTDTSANPVPARYWRTRPLYDATMLGAPFDELRRLVGHGTNSDTSKLDIQVERWRKNPFNPHLIARLRTSAYPKAVVMMYIDNLIAWGDQLFQLDSIEAINEATHLYIIVADILGARPESIPPRTRPAVRTFTELRGYLDAFSNALAAIESQIASSPPAAPATPTSAPLASMLAQTLYFGIPQNDHMLRYWDTVADRLFKIRHCMNIQGAARQLPQFESPIDVALLVKAAAAGVDLATGAVSGAVALPLYRFQSMIQKANELCADVKALGSALLAALEKKDAEALAVLRGSHEVQALEAARAVKEQQIAEAATSLAGLLKSREMVGRRHEFYKQIEFMSPWELAALSLSGSALISQGVGVALHMAAGAAATGGPEVSAGVSGLGPHLTAQYGGEHVAGGLEAWAGGFREAATILNMGAGMSATLGGYWRRWDEWKLQESLAATELQQMDKQILAAEIRRDIAVRDLQNHDRQVVNARAVEAFMREKFTNRDLYDWTVGQVASTYFQTYQLAYDIARRAQRAFDYELGVSGPPYIQPQGYWDSLKKGLLAGERLHFDLKRLELAYLDQNKRQFELTRPVSLALIDPIQLLTLKATGLCQVTLSESLFDLDYPGHYLRRIKSVSLTIPSVTGPYTNVNCTLTLLANTYRKSKDVLPAYKSTGPGDTRFVADPGGVQSVATSNAQNDSGLFEMNFHDERYLPFEGAGAQSTWSLALPADSNQFDLSTIPDVILHVKYTALDGGDALRTAAIRERPKTGTRLFSMRHDFPTEWARFKAAELGAGRPTAALTVTLRDDHYPFWTRGLQKKIKRAAWFAATAKDHVDVVELVDGTGRRDALTVSPLFGVLRTALNWTLPAPAAVGTPTFYFADTAIDELFLELDWEAV
jgi:hypothetical protein